MINLYRKIKQHLDSLIGRYKNKRYRKLFQKKGSRRIDANKQIYYIIRRNPPGAGFFSNYLCVLSHMAFAMERKYMPVVDMKHYPTLYSERETIKGTKNAWEYYFRQVQDVSLKEAYKSRNYILSETGFQEEGNRFLKTVYSFPLEDGVEFYYGLSSQIKMEKTLETELQEESRKLSLRKEKTLGVHVRGTDMSSGKHSHDHPQSLCIQDYIEMTEQFLSEDREISQIFLATDEEEIEYAFKKNFGLKVHTSCAFRAKEGTEKGIHLTINGQRKYHGYLLGKEVVKDVFLLSQCDKLICGFSNVASTAIIWNHNQYEKIGILCRKQYGEKLTSEIAKKHNINQDRYVVKSI